MVSVVMFAMIAMRFMLLLMLVSAEEGIFNELVTTF